MKKHTFITLFIGTNIMFIFLQIHKHNLVINQSYRKQTNEHARATLVQKKRQLTQQLYALKDRSAIKQFAQENLNMSPIKLGQINKLNSHE